MTQRSILSGRTPQVIIRSGADVTVKSWDRDRIFAESTGIWGLQVKRKNNVIEIEFGGSGQVLVPFESSLKVYSGKSAEIEAINGALVAVAGQDLRISEGNILVQASAGKAMDIDCRTIQGQALKLSAGRDLRCRIRDLDNVRYVVDDLGGKWQAVLEDGSTTLHLTAGGDVTLAAGKEIRGEPPDFVLGKIE